MKSSIDHEKIFFNYFLKKPQYLKSTRPGFFSNSDLDHIAKLSKDFYTKFSEAPSKEQMKALVKDDPNEISDDIVNAIYEININEYDQDWLKRTGEAWVKWKHFDKQLVKTIEYVKTQDVSPENVEDVVTRAIGMISTDGSLNFDTDVGLDFFNPEHHIQRKTKKLETGWSFIDNVSGGGYDPKSLIVYAGEQNVGKSIWLANDAANFVRMGHNVVFVTAEMSAQKVLKRIGSNLLQIPMMEYDKHSANRDYVKRRLERITRGIMPPGKLFVKEFPTSQGTVLDIEAYLKDLEETQDHKVNVLVVDYINILANYRNPNTENTYMKIKQIAEDLRALAVKRDMLVISATQINRGAWDSTEIKMENIAESAGLAHTADVMYALIQDAMMHANREYWLKVLKIRDGQGKGSRCRYNIDYDFMRLTETDDVN
jgi:KaiC/GvpD/RAD55 family RecA-like ATPase|tara:strand:- start:10 stop:1293 length:1284 start_codon:yes stop_codon:yes gene_type:complete